MLLIRLEREQSIRMLLIRLEREQSIIFAVENIYIYL